MRFSRRTALTGLIAACVAGRRASAKNDIMQKIVSDPGTFWQLWGPIKASYVSDNRVDGGAVQRLTIAPKPPRPWDAGAFVTVSKPVRKGDILLLTFWARSESTPAGSDLIIVTGRVYENMSGGVDLTANQTFLIGKQWKPYFISLRVTKDYPGGVLAGGLLVGTGEQTIDFGPVSVIDFGQNYNMASLPRN